MSSSSEKDVSFSLKAMINKENTKVLFVEADSEFVDVLLSFLTFPLGTIGRVLEKHYGDKAPVIGSLNTLYNGLSNLGNVHFQNEGCKQMLLNPRSSFSDECRNLKIDISDTQPIKYFSCENVMCGDSEENIHIGMYYGSTCCRCGRFLEREIKYKTYVDVLFGNYVHDSPRFFTAKTAYFIISDDLRLAPNVEGPILETLTNLGITNTCGALLMEVAFGYNEIMELLKGMFVSRSPLTDIILGKTKGCTATPNSEPAGILLHKTEKVAAANSDSKKFILKAIIQKSSNKLCFVRAGKDFIDFLFSLLTIPLCGVEYLLGSNTCLANVDNVYKSLASISGCKYFYTEEIKNRLLNPEIPYGYVSESQILPLIEEPKPILYFHPKYMVSGRYLSTDPWCGFCPGTLVENFNSPRCKGNYVKGLRMFMVTDDLTVTPLFMSTILSKLNELQVPLSDVEEVDVHIGLEEALSILKASLTSTSALTDSLIKPLMLKKCVKLEN